MTASEREYIDRQFQRLLVHFEEYEPLYRKRLNIACREDFLEILQNTFVVLWKKFLSGDERPHHQTTDPFLAYHNLYPLVIAYMGWQKMAYYKSSSRDRTKYLQLLDNLISENPDLEKLPEFQSLEKNYHWEDLQNKKGG